MVNFLATVIYDFHISINITKRRESNLPYILCVAVCVFWLMSAFLCVYHAHTEKNTRKKTKKANRKDKALRKINKYIKARVKEKLP